MANLTSLVYKYPYQVIFQLLYFSHTHPGIAYVKIFRHCIVTHTHNKAAIRSWWYFFSCYHDRVYWLLKHWLDQKCQPNWEDEVSDEESSTHSPQQPQQVEGVKTGPLRHTSLHSAGCFDCFLLYIYRRWKLHFMDDASCVRVKHSAYINYEWLFIKTYKNMALRPDAPSPLVYNILKAILAVMI